MLKKIECKCGESHIAIDTDSVTYVCGVVGLVAAQNISAFGGKVECAICKTIIFDQRGEK